MAELTSVGMAVLGITSRVGLVHREDVTRNLVAIFLAFALHIVLFQLFISKASFPKMDGETYITVKLIKPLSKPKSKTPIAAESVTSSVTPQSKTISRSEPVTPKAPSIIAEAPQILTSREPATSTDQGNTVPLSERGVTPSPMPKSTSDARIDEGLKALGENLSCLTSFDTECADIRKDVFKEFQMSETDKVYTKKYAHTGLPVEFYGLGEREIRQKLGLHLAGENGIVLIPGLLAIDGRWWDNLHGVNKHCEWKFAAPAKSDPFTRSGELSSAVRHGVIKDCPNYLPAAKEDRVRRNKFKLKVNE